MNDSDKYTKLGEAFLEGDGVSKDYEQAYYWLNEACKLESDKAAELMRAMRERGLGAPFDGEILDATCDVATNENENEEQERRLSDPPFDMKRVNVNPNRCVACGAEALEPSKVFAGAKHCSPNRGGCGTNSMIPIEEQNLNRGFALQPYSEVPFGQNSKTYSSLGMLIHQIKYGSYADDLMKAEMISEIATRIVECGIIEQLTGYTPSHEFTVVPAPSSKHRTVQPVELLAKFIAEAGYKYEKALTKKTAVESKYRPRGAELEPGDVRCTKNVQGASILLIDDTYGEGATLRACIRALKEKGAQKIYFLSICKNTYGGMKGGANDDDIH